MTFRFRSVLHDGSFLRRKARLVDILGVGVDILRTFADGGDSLHDAVLGAKHGSGGVRVDLLGVFASENFQTSSSEQNAGSEQTEMFHL